MKKYYYDLHIHSCLSPCGDDDMTPNNICGMAAIKGLDIIALTDHNTCGNCRSFAKCAENNGLTPVFGMEMTTGEDIHLVCLFESIESAEAFSNEVSTHRTLFPNRVDIYGQQMYMDENDEVVGVDEYFLPIATDIYLDDAVKMVERNGGVSYPAHIDRESNGIVAVLGTLPDNPFFNCIELHEKEKLDELKRSIPSLEGKKVLVNSDAHYLWDINEAENYLELDDGLEGDDLKKALFDYIRNNTESL